jgi:hypothetical protein
MVQRRELKLQGLGRFVPEWHPLPVCRPATMLVRALHDGCSLGFGMYSHGALHPSGVALDGAAGACMRISDRAQLL